MGCGCALRDDIGGIYILKVTAYFLITLFNSCACNYNRCSCAMSHSFDTSLRWAKKNKRLQLHCIFPQYHVVQLVDIRSFDHDMLCRCVRYIIAGVSMYGYLFGQTKRIAFGTAGIYIKTKTTYNNMITILLLQASITKIPQTLEHTPSRVFLGEAPQYFFVINSN